MHAAWDDHLDIVEYLVERGADVNVKDSKGMTALMRVTGRDSWGSGVLQYLIDNGADVNATAMNGWTALRCAADGEDPDIVDYLFKHGADVSAKDTDGWTAVVWAAEQGHFDFVRDFVEKGADVNAKDVHGRTLLMWAVARDTLDTVRYLIEQGADVHAKAPDGRTALVWACERDDLNLIEHLVQHGADVNAKDADGWTVLLRATDRGVYETVQYLVEQGADVNATNSYLESALAIASKHEYQEIQRFLMQYIPAASSIQRDSLPMSTSTLQSLPEWTISPFDVTTKQFIEAGNIGGNFLATWLDADVVLKLFVPHNGNASFAEEVRLWHQLRHPNVIKLYGACDIGHHFFVCEHASRGSVVDYLAKCDKGARTPWKYLHEAALGLAYLHERWIVHGSLCGSSILIGSDGLAKLADFRLKSLTRRGKTKGLLHWQSPEQRKGAKASNASDIFSLGICAIQVMLGLSEELLPHFPGYGNNAFLSTARVKKMLKGDLGEVVARTCHHDPARRLPASACVQLFKRLADKESVKSENAPSAPEAAENISEISNSWVIPQKLETEEELLAFLQLEISQSSAHHSAASLMNMQQAYDDLKSKLDTNEDFATKLPVWFVRLNELTEASGDQIEIGAGGFGSVHLAKWLDSDVVVKRLESQPADDAWETAYLVSTTATSNKKLGAEERRRFEREVNIWFNLSHPHVVRLFGACHVGPQPFFVCEYASNGSLDKYLLQHPGEIWEKLHEAALGLLYLHERHVMHCDLKCNNIVVGSDKKAKVTDFGLSLAASIDDDGHDDDAGKSGNITGAWNWLSPELMLGHSKTPTRESDVFSFGMCIVEALRVVAAAQVEPEEREKLPPRVPWQRLLRQPVEYYMKRKQLPERPIGCTDAQWELVEKMCKFNPSERIQICTVVDELSVLAGLHQAKQLSQQLTSKSPQLDVSAVASSVKNHMAHDKIYLVHELLWARIEDIQTRLNGKVDGSVDALNRLGLFADDAQSRAITISAHSDSLINFTELALQAYGLHRRLDKLMAAAFVRIDGDDATGTNVHYWKRRCYEFLGVDSSVAAQLLRAGDQSSREANAA